MTLLSRRALALTTGALAALAGLRAAEAATSDVTLRIANYGGNFTQTQQKYVGERFTADTGIKIEWIDGNPRNHVQRMLASRGRGAPFDVVYLDDTTHPDAQAARLLAKLDPKIVTNLSQVYPEALNAEGYGPAMLFWSWGLLYNAKIFAEKGIPAPSSWNDLWNPKLAGRVAIADVDGPGGVDFILTMARMNGGSEKDVAAGLAKIRDLKPLYYFRSSVDLRSKFQSGDVWAAPWNNGQSNSLIDGGFPGKFIYPREQGILHTTTIDVTAGSAYPKEAMMFVNYTLDPLAQLGQAVEIPYGPVNKTLAAVMAAYPDLSRKFPATEADLSTLARADWITLNQNLPAIVDQWNRIVKRG